MKFCPRQGKCLLKTRRNSAGDKGNREILLETGKYGNSAVDKGNRTILLEPRLEIREIKKFC